MKKTEHEVYAAVDVQCACGNRFTTRSTSAGPLRLEVCSSCHPFFTGKQKQIVSTGRIEQFNRRYARQDRVHAVVRDESTSPVEPIRGGN